MKHKRGPLKIFIPQFVIPFYINKTTNSLLFQIDFLSPSLFSLHDKGEGLEKMTSLPQLLNGFTTKEQDLWMNFILEAAGVNAEAERMENVGIWGFFDLKNVKFENFD